MSLIERIKLLKLIKNRVSKGISLRVLLVVPLVLHLFGAVVLVGYLSLKNCHQTVNQLANELTDKVSITVERQLDPYLKTPHQVTGLNVKTIKQGLLDLQSQNAEHYFWEQMQLFDVSQISYGLTTGEFLSASRPEGQGITIDSNKNELVYTYATDSQGNRGNVVKVYDYKPQNQAWYVDTIKAAKPNWSQVYTRQKPDNVGLSISANHPIYDQNDQIIGVTSSALKLDDVSKFLHSLKVSASGKVFVIERNGLLVADSSLEKPFEEVNGKVQRINVLNSSDRTIQTTAKYIQHKFGDFSQINSDQKFNFQTHHDLMVVHIKPWRDNFGLDWLVIVAVPESDFMAQVHANAQVILLLSLVALVAATSLGLTISRWIVTPIHRLSEASIAIAASTLR